MADPFLGELRLFSFNFPPQGWAFANGQLLPINQNQPLFSLFGTTYGGDGRVNFALPNLRGRVPVHMGNVFTQGQAGGEEAHTITQSEMPTHTHLVNASTAAATAGNPSNARVLSQSTGANLYGAASNFVQMNPQAVSSVGGSQPHENRQPFIALNFCVALQGIFPSRN